MRFFLILLLPAALLAQDPTPLPSATPAPTPAPTPEADVTARAKALEIASAFTNEGYKIRDGVWAGSIEPGRPQLLEVNLFTGNEYWFSAAAASPARKVAVSVFNESGQPVDYLAYSDGSAGAAGFEPSTSGCYIVKLDLLEGEKAAFCLIYSYK